MGRSSWCAVWATTAAWPPAPMRMSVGVVGMGCVSVLFGEKREKADPGVWIGLFECDAGL